MEFLRLLWAPIRSRLQYDGSDMGGSRSTGSAEAFTLLSLANPINLSTVQILDSDPVVSELRWKYINEFREIFRLGRKLASAIFQTPLYDPLYSIFKIADGTNQEGLLLDILKMVEDPLLKPYIDVVQGRIDLVFFSIIAAELDWFSDRAQDNLQDVYSLEDIGQFIEELDRAFCANLVINSCERLSTSFDDLRKVVVWISKALEVAAVDSTKKGCLAVKFGEYLLTPVFQEEMKNLIYNYSKCSLHEAAGTDDIEMLQKLLEGRANKDNKDCRGKTALHYSCVFGSEQCTEALLEAGCDVFAMDVYGNTALHYAAAHGRHGCVELLLKSRAAVMLENKKGETPIDIAKSRKHYDVLTLLEEAAFKISSKVWPFELENEGLLVHTSFWNNMFSFKSCF